MRISSIGFMRAALCLAVLGTLTSCFSSVSTTCSTGIVCPAATRCSSDGSSCIKDSCGDGKLESPEVCDDGNIVSGDGCSSDCQSDEKCGTGKVDTITGEICDDHNNVAGDGCSADCKSDERCGNGVPPAT